MAPPRILTEEERIWRTLTDWVRNGLPSAPSSGAAWGDITGTLSAQTDLQTALDGKSATSHSHSGTYEPAGAAAAAVAAHVGAIDPHSGYLTPAEGDAAYSGIGHSHSGLAPSGGSTGQVLKKLSNTSFDYAWAADETSMIGGGLGDPGASGIVVRTMLNTTASRSLSQPAAGLTISNADGVLANPTFALANDLAAVEGLSATGLVRRTAVDTWSAGAPVAYAELQNVSATDKLLGRATAGAGTVEEIACTAAGRALLDDADNTAQRTTLGLGVAATLNVGTTAGTVAAGDHGHAQLHNQSHALTSTSDHTAGNWKVWYSNGSGQVVELALGSSGQVLQSNGPAAAPSFAAPGASSNEIVFNQSTAQQGAGFAADTYLTGSYIVIPSGRLKVGTRYHLVFDVTKTAAGTAAPVITVRVGTAGSTADTGRATLTFLAQTAAADDGTFEVWITVRAIGATAVLQVVAQCQHRLSTTGLQNQPGTTVRATSAAFDITPANTGIGVSVNGGASASWTVQLVQAELMNLA